MICGDFRPIIKKIVKDGKSIVVGSIAWSFGTKICPDGAMGGLSSFLTPIRSWNYHLEAMGGFDSELVRKENRGARKSQFSSAEIRDLQALRRLLDRD
jgi:hypothetical protein